MGCKECKCEEFEPKFEDLSDAFDSEECPDCSDHAATAHEHGTRKMPDTCLLSDDGIVHWRTQKGRKFFYDPVLHDRHADVLTADCWARAFIKGGVKATGSSKEYVRPVSGTIRDVTCIMCLAKAGQSL
jgi:hypothetical protein